MDLTTILVVAIVAATFLLWTWMTRRRPESAPLLASASSKKRLPIVQKQCQACKHWNHARGQAEIASHPAFMGAAQHLLPWQMSRARPTKPNPAFLAQQEKVGVALADEQQAKRDGNLDMYRQLREEREQLEKELMLIPPDIFDDEEVADIAPETFNMTWADFGACTKPGSDTMTSRVDTCEDWTLADEKQLEAAS